MDIMNPNRRSLLQIGSMAGIAAATQSFTTIAFAAGETTMNVVTSNSILTNALLILHDQKGFLKSFGLSMKTTKVSDNTVAIPSLISGESDAAVSIAFTALFPAISRGAELKLLGGNSLLYQQCVYAKDPAIKGVKDLVGKSVGTGGVGGAAYMMMTELLVKNNVDPSKVTFRNVGSSADILRAVVAGTVDAGPGGLEVYDDGSKFGIHALSDGAFWEQFPDYTYQGTFTSAQKIADKDKRDALVRVLAGYAMLYKYVQTPEAKDSFLKAYIEAAGRDTAMDEALSQWNFIQRTHPFSTDIALSENQLKVVQDISIRQGVQKEFVPYDKAADMSLARDAVKLMQQKT